MAAMKSGDEIYDVNKYTDDELYSVLDLVNPTDRELEARLYHLINKYKNMETDSGDKLANFFNNIYARFFELVVDDSQNDGNNDKTDENMESTNNSTQDKGGEKIALTTSIEYVRDPQSINPLLKQTITRIISVDSQYRNNKKTTLGTNFSFNLSDSLRDVVALRLHSIQIPKTWYTINKNYGANFFYLKGNSPGINDGNYDYKIAIKPGNYTASELNTTVSTAISTLKSTYTDTSFGTTDITYNTYTGRSTFTLDITKIYNEPSFSLDFPTFTWHESESEVGAFTTIPAILGYNRDTYVPNSAYSMRYANFSDSDTFWLTSSNNYFKIIQYPGYTNSNYVYAYNDVSYQTITITSSLNVDASYSRSDLFTDFNTQLAAASNLSGASIELMTITDASAINPGYYYYKFTLPLNPYTQTLTKDSKTVALFPEDSNVWIGSESCFKLESATIELSDIKGESETSTSDFTVGNAVYIYLKCKRSGYTELDDGFTKNSVGIKITPGTYALDAYIAQINSDISNNNDDGIFTLDSNTDLITTSFAVNAKSEYKPRTRYYLRKTFGTESYSIDTFDNCGNAYYFGSTLDMSLVDYNFSENPSSISGKILSQSTYELPFDTVFFKVKPYTILGLGNKNAAAYEVMFTESVYNDISHNLSESANANPPFYNDSDLKYIFNYTITHWQDPILGIYPFSDTTVKFGNYSATAGTIDISLNMVINVELTTKDYIVKYVDPSNSWYNYLYLDSSYNLESYMSYDSRFDFSYSDIIMSTVRFSNQITITSSNNTFYIKATGDGVYDSTDANTLTVVVDKGTYTVDEIIVNINSKLATVSPGSLVQKDSSGNVSFRMNVNKVYYTKDYRLVFYDPYSFVKCITGSSSVQNTSWDSTIGWILGFHTLTEYPLGSSYIEVDSNDSSVQYYSGTESEYTYNTSTNIATIMGDTNVNVNLYNYFMIILDDYAQNHLNDGMVTITPAESNITPSSYANRATYRCDPETGEQVFYGTTNAGNKNTAKEVYSANQKLAARKATAKIYSSGPFIQDIFALIPLNVSGLANGAIFTDTGSALNKQERWYFGPVNISRMTVKLINDRGEVVDLNGSNWSLSFQCDQLYQQKSTK
jgi:predicted nucleic-acid-binding Zn-ribbon protein